LRPRIEFQWLEQVLTRPII